MKNSEIALACNEMRVGVITLVKFETNLKVYVYVLGCPESFFRSFRK